ncbi:hypothetical protein [Streptomyces longwoodensis]
MATAEARADVAHVPPAVADLAAKGKKPQISALADLPSGGATLPQHPFS